MIVPNQLKPNDIVGLVCPSSPVSRQRVLACKAFVEGLGYQVKVGRACYESYHGYLAGSSVQRADDINLMFAEPTVKAIFCIRGGYGSSQIMELLDYEVIARNPKIFVGYSDITNLNVAFNTLCNMVTYHGPMVSSNMLEHFDEYTRRSFEAALRMETELIHQNPAAEPMKVLAPGACEGIVVGGNLALIINLLGTFYAPDFHNKVLFIEDIYESIPRIHRMLDQLRLLHIFDQVAGVLVGDFSESSKEDNDTYGIEDFLQEYFADMKIPVMSNVKCGHCYPTATIPLGLTCTMDTNSNLVKFSR
jgi:muramoyltetrapeptide carboxypeptidase